MSISDELNAMARDLRRAERAGGTGADARRARYEQKTRNRPSKVTHCPQGHVYDEVNTHWNAAGRRMCLTCHSARRVHSHLANGNQSSSTYKGREIIDLRPFLAASRESENPITD